MTQIKKFTWIGTAIALAMVITMATIVSTANAAVLSIARTSGAVEAGDTNTITIVGNNSAGDLTVTATTGTFGPAAANIDCSGFPCDLAASPGGVGTNIVVILATSDTTVVTINWDAPATVTNPGTVTVSATQGATAMSTTFTLRGPAATIALVALELAPTGNACGGEVASIIGTSASANGLQTAQLCALVRDAAGNLLPGVSVIFSTTAGTLTAAGVTTSGSPANGRALSALNAAAGTAAGATATVTAASGNANGTTTVVFGGDVTACSIDAPLAVALGGTLTATVSADDAAGHGSPDNTTLSLTAIHSGTGQNVGVVPSAVTALENGERDFTVLSAIQGPISLIAEVQGAAGLTINCTANVQVGPVGMTPPVTGGFTGTIAPSGVSLVTFGGGALADFAAAGTATGAVSVWTTVGGSFIGWIPGAPSVVNAAFFAQFAGGFPAGTIVIIVK